MKFVNLHTHNFTDNSDYLEVVNQYPNEFNSGIPKYSIGIHPWHINEETLQTDLNLIETKLQLTECLALGECGLDKRIKTPLKFQIEVFVQQLNLIKTSNKPIILHCVAAFDEIIAIKRSLNINNPFIIHGFSKNYQLAKQLLDSGFYLSFGKYLLKNPELEFVFNKIPDDKFLLETDTIDENLIEIYKFAAKYKNQNILEIKKTVWNNFNHLFYQ